MQYVSPDGEGLARLGEGEGWREGSTVGCMYGVGGKRCEMVARSYKE